MLSEKDKEELNEVFENAKKGEPTAYIACLFMTEEQKEYMKALLNDCKETL